MKKVLLLLCFALCASMTFGQTHHEAANTATFLFIGGDDGLYRLEGNNAEELSRLYHYVDLHKSAIRNGELPVHVNGYSSDMATEAANLHIAKVRSNRVKSELITHKGLREHDFRTVNHATSHNGHRAVVVVTIGARAEQDIVEACPFKEKFETFEKVQHAEAQKVANLQHKVGALENRVTNLENEVKVDEAMVLAMMKTFFAEKAEPAWKEPYSFALRTNLLYWTGLLPNLGIEWRVAKRFGIKVDGHFSNWKFKKQQNRVHKMWMVSPELRFYLGQEARIYLGLGGNFGKADMSWRPFSKLYNVNHGYEGDFWNAGLVLGYQARLSRKLSLDFNLGFGMSRFNYDTYDVASRTEIGAKQKKDIWGVTQAGATLVWRFGRNKK